MCCSGTRRRRCRVQRRARPGWGSRRHDRCRPCRRTHGSPAPRRPRRARRSHAQAGGNARRIGCTSPAAGTSSPLAAGSGAPLATPSAFAQANVYVYGSPPPSTFAGPNEAPQIFYAQLWPTVLTPNATVRISAITTTNVQKVTIGTQSTKIGLSPLGSGTWQGVVLREHALAAADRDDDAAHADRLAQRRSEREHPDPGLPQPAGAAALVSCGAAYAAAPWHFLYFLPLPHGQSSLRPTLSATAVFGFAGSPSPRFVWSCVASYFGAGPSSRSAVA